MGIKEMNYLGKNNDNETVRLSKQVLRKYPNHTHYFDKREAEDTVKIIKDNGFDAKYITEKFGKEIVYIVISDAPDWAYDAGGSSVGWRRR
jgi:hypothetical protein